MAWSVDVTHVDTCLSCYVQDHCNGSDELLLGVTVDGNTTYQQVRDALLDEWRTYGDKAPDEVTDELFEAAVDEQFSTADANAVFDKSLEVPDEDAEQDGESCMAWFRVTWTEVEDQDGEPEPDCSGIEGSVPNGATGTNVDDTVDSRGVKLRPRVNDAGEPWWM